MSTNFDAWLESYQQSIARPLIEVNEGHRVSRILGRLDVVALKAAYEAGVKKGEQHGAPVQFSREDQSGCGQGSNEVDEQGEKTNA